MPFALALNDSLQSFNEEVTLNILISDQAELSDLNFPKNVQVHFYTEICDSGIAKEIAIKYQDQYHDAFRWSMKPVYMNYLLQLWERVIYVDCDIQFVSNYDFLFDLLKINSVLLSPHFRSSDPIKDRDNFLLQFYSGLFNGGFVGANKSGSDALNWWANACLEICEKTPELGQFDDQTHLNLLPIFFDKIHVIKHRGCNVANWNQLECRRSLEEGEILINKEFPIVFIHFTGTTIRGVLKGEDSLLMAHLQEYNKRLMSYGLKASLLVKDKSAKESKTLIQRLKSKLGRLIRI